MRLRTFTAADMPAAMKMVRDAMGDGAVILASERHDGRRGITVTAAIEHPDEPLSSHAPPRLAARRSEPVEHYGLKSEMENLLRFHNLPESFIARIMRKVSDRELSAITGLHRISSNRDSGQLLRLSLEKLLAACFAFDPLPLDQGALRLMLIGPPGAGKTLTIAKMAAALSLRKRKLAVITADDKRAGGVEQLQAFTSILGLKLEIAPTREELAEVMRAQPPGVCVLVDTAGGNPYDADAMDELQSLATLKGVEPVLVLPAGGDSLEAADMTEAFARFPIRRLLVTRADTARRFGGALTAAMAHDLAFCQISDSPSIAGSLHAADHSLLARQLLRHADSSSSSLQTGQNPLKSAKL